MRLNSRLQLLLEEPRDPGKNDGAQRVSPEHREQRKRALADPRGVEILISQAASEEEDLPNLDSARIASRTRRNLNCGRRKRNALGGRTTSADHGASCQG